MPRDSSRTRERVVAKAIGLPIFDIIDRQLPTVGPIAARADDRALDSRALDRATSNGHHFVAAVRGPGVVPCIDLNDKIGEKARLERVVFLGAQRLDKTKCRAGRTSLMNVRLDVFCTGPFKSHT